MIFILATREGFEPPTFGFGDQRSARLNYRAINWVLASGIEPDCLTPYLPSTFLRRPAS
jgi:hypothetical protein